MPFFESILIIRSKKVKASISGSPAKLLFGRSYNEQSIEEMVNEQVAAMAEKQDGETAQERLEPDPILELESVISYSGGKGLSNRVAIGSVLWTADGNNIIFPSGEIVVIMHAGSIDDGEPSRDQYLLFGHTANVSMMAISQEGDLLATGQEGKLPMIKIWQLEKHAGNGVSIRANCLSTLTAHAGDLAALDFSDDGRLLCAVGKDAQSRTQMIVSSSCRFVDLRARLNRPPRVPICHV